MPRRVDDIDTSQGLSQNFALSFTSLTIILLSLFIYIDTLVAGNVIRESSVLESLQDYFAPKRKKASRQDSPLQVLEVAKEAQLKVVRSADNIRISVPGAELFESGSDQIRAEMWPVLNEISESLKNHPLHVRIEGHTDSQAISSFRFSSNWDLSVARAVSVLRFLLAKGIPVERLSAAGRAEFHPVASNETEEGRALNRRVVLHIFSQAKLGSGGGSE